MKRIALVVITSSTYVYNVLREQMLISSPLLRGEREGGGSGAEGQKSRIAEVCFSA